MPNSSATDDGFREIQLNGKQLVFLFMAATVVSVVIFLCGVLVGRGVRPVSGEPVAAAQAPETPPLEAPAAQASSATQPVAAEPPPTPDELSYYDRLEKDKAPAETLKPAAPAAAKVAPPAPRARSVDRPPSAATPAPAAATPAPAATTGEPGGPGYAVQVAALQARGEADSIAKRLTGKGYPAYVMAPASGASAPIYRVRVGKYKSRREAEQVAARLEREEQFKPWISR